MTFLIGKVDLSFEEFLALPRVVGWKYEYINGAAYIEPRGCPVGAVLSLDEGREPDLATSPISEVEQLQSLFVASFSGTADYAGFSAERMTQRAQRSLAAHRDGKRGQPRGESRVVTRDGEPVAAALIVQKAHGPHLDMVMVHPGYRREGLAKLLLGVVVERLLENGERSLTSAYHLSNEPSRAWHRSQGFREIPDLYAERMRQRHRLHIEGERTKKARPSRQKVWLDELARQHGEEAAYTLELLLRPGRVGRVKCPEWLQDILDSPQRLP